MKQSMAEFKKGHALLLTTTGLATAAMAAGVQPAQAEGLYAGISFGAVSGEAPFEEWSSSPEDYSLAGTSTSVFVGAKFIDFGTFSLGGELAFSGNADGDPDLNSSYDGGYDINWVGDAKLRLSADVGKLPGQDSGSITVYGFVGGSIGDASNYYTSGYTFSGSNFGVGVEATLPNNMFVGLEVIQRNVDTYDNYGVTTHQAASLRVGFKF
jgi:hypothetical protein